MESKENQETPYNITPQGSLGLLALGAVGVRKWKEVCAEKEKMKLENQPDNQTSSNTDKTKVDE